MLVGLWPMVVGDRVPGQGLVSSSGCRASEWQPRVPPVSPPPVSFPAPKVSRLVLPSLWALLSGKASLALDSGVPSTRSAHSPEPSEGSGRGPPAASLHPPPSHQGSGLFA